MCILQVYTSVILCLRLDLHICLQPPLDDGTSLMICITPPYILRYNLVSDLTHIWWFSKGNILISKKT